MYGNDAVNLSQYGRLYNGYAVQDSRGLCPSGWHVPSDEEWKQLEMALGMSASQANQGGWRGDNQGLYLKSSSSDDPPWDGLNSSGFSTLPAGAREVGGGYGYMGSHGFWWTTTLGRELNSGNPKVRRDGWDIRTGFAVRCVANE
jgi:uncharacterized protein (TIGR02145 family)